MAKHYSSFNSKQQMTAADFEIFFYEDKSIFDVSMHKHDYYEIYFFLEGGLEYQIGKDTFRMNYGDFCLIPPGIMHRPVFTDKTIPYRRMVLWISPAYLDIFINAMPSLKYCFDYCNEKKSYHFSCDFSEAGLLFNKLINIEEEANSMETFHEEMISVHIASLLISINRIIHKKQQPRGAISQEFLFNKICAYINSHIESDISLDTLASEFFVSKYHIAHVFKDSMGISVHQYIIKKRLDAAKNGILTGMPLKNVSENYGFPDYSSFYRAFKKEFGYSPREFKDLSNLLDSSIVAEDTV